MSRKTNDIAENTLTFCLFHLYLLLFPKKVSSNPKCNQIISNLSICYLSLSGTPLIFRYLYQEINFRRDFYFFVQEDV